ncbi:MAG: transposase, partial [Candidatus Azotimanducaceae bacterium]
MKITTVGIDLAKSVLQVHGVNEQGKKAFIKQLRPKQVLLFFT